MRPCEEGKPCKYEEIDWQENAVICRIDFDGTGCPYIKPWGKRKYREDHPAYFQEHLIKECNP